MVKLKGTPLKLPKLPPREFATVLTFVASQTLDIVWTIQVLQLVTTVSMMNNDFDDNR